MEKTVFFRAFEPEDVDLIHLWKNDDELNELTVGLNIISIVLPKLERSLSETQILMMVMHGLNRFFSYSSMLLKG